MSVCVRLCLCPRHDLAWFVCIKPKTKFGGPSYQQMRHNNNNNNNNNNMTSSLPAHTSVCCPHEKRTTDSATCSPGKWNRTVEIRKTKNKYLHEPFKDCLTSISQTFMFSSTIKSNRTNSKKFLKQIKGAGVSLEAGYRRSTAAYVASRRRFWKGDINITRLRDPVRDSSLSNTRQQNGDI